jgi:hypothetical protein
MRGNMRKLLTHSIFVILVLVTFSGFTAAQMDSPGAKSLHLTNDPGGPPPSHDLNGTWVGPIQRAVGETPQFTPLGQERFKQNKPEATSTLARTNDPVARTCDPMGFPRNMLADMRGVPVGEMLPMTFATLPNRMIVLTQWQQVWRQISMDGRELPKNVGGRQKGAPDSRYYGYSVGHWESDNVFVADSIGLADGTWLSRFGYPHTVETRIQERLTRSSHNDLQLTITVEDPKLYVKPFMLTKMDFKWLPDQGADGYELMCVPSEVMEYLKIVGDQAN